MPYPIEKLPYGLRRRFRELTTPSEAYDFQIAAPHYIGFQPIQKAISVQQVSFLIDKSNNLQKSINWGEGSADNNELVYIASFNLTFDCFNTPNNYLNGILDNFRFSPDEIYLYDCILDTTFVQTFLRSLNSPNTHMELYPCSFTSENAVKMICNAYAFKSLRSFTIMEPPVVSSVNTWIEAFVEAECTSLKRFDVLNAPPSVFEIIDKAIFLKFFKAQPDKFNIEFVLSEEAEQESVTDVLKNLFDEHFERGEKGNYLRKEKYVNITLKDNLGWGYTLRAE